MVVSDVEAKFRCCLNKETIKKGEKVCFLTYKIFGLLHSFIEMGLVYVQMFVFNQPVKKTGEKWYLLLT